MGTMSSSWFFNYCSCTNFCLKWIWYQLLFDMKNSYPAILPLLLLLFLLLLLLHELLLLMLLLLLAPPLAPTFGSDNHFAKPKSLVSDFFWKTFLQEFGRETELMRQNCMKMKNRFHESLLFDQETVAQRFLWVGEGSSMKIWEARFWGQ